MMEEQGKCNRIRDNPPRKASLREQVDLILMYMNMPVMDGIEATRRIRAAESSGVFIGRRRHSMLI